MSVNFGITDIRLYALNYSVTAAKRPANQTAIPIKTDYKYQSFHDEQKQEYRVILGVHLYGEFLPYILQVDVIGTFIFEKSPDNEEERLFTTTTSPTILFPYLREVVSDTIQRAGHPPVYLQPINFHEVYLQSQSKDEQATRALNDSKNT